MSSFELSKYVSGQDATNAPPLRLLSLDGGGIRRLSELIILDEIMNRLKYHLKSPIDLLPADYFDMICGTDTGGLIALLLGRLRLSTAEAIRFYASLGKEIFKNKRSKRPYGHAFDSSNIEGAIKNLLEVKYGNGHGDDRMLADEEENRHACKAQGIWEAARATCAAPRFPQSIFIDAGFDCDNPIQQLISEANTEFDRTRSVACIVSIGAGIPKALGFTRPKSLTEKVAPISLVKVLEGMATSIEREAAEMEKKYRNIPGIYHRVNVGRDIGLEEWEELGQVQSHTRAYLRKDGISRQIDSIVVALVHKAQPEIRLHQLDNHVTLPSTTAHI
ncbi:hypothetical protein EAE96_006475 [Botrytis aclada]|nr:hypothetical protein EAE96_006475 [Botrytis aclada]